MTACAHWKPSTEKTDSKSSNILKDPSKPLCPCPALSKFLWGHEQTLETQVIKERSSNTCINFNKASSFKATFPEIISPILIPPGGRAHSGKTVLKNPDNTDAWKQQPRKHPEGIKISPLQTLPSIVWPLKKPNPTPNTQAKHFCVSSNPTAGNEQWDFSHFSLPYRTVCGPHRTGQHPNQHPLPGIFTDPGTG